ncbi:MAG: bifunctional demethylmenaquinone methyltransferase/2-methoxy-6-polyprenyl-1,4-benzoquinol methylase UbiE [Firmicutes bacterium]|nr:bifunctional demethylmenaquinone methyltransferase/2-methoxy-6-polyprenyl-1,4-benzoquinol methylase UbiE [Bacillota bacterium]
MIPGVGSISPVRRGAAPEPPPGQVVGDKEAYVREMFSRIAPVYDLMNRVLSLHQDVRWRRVTALAAGVGPGDMVLDVATGTGDLILALARLVSPGGQVVGVDFCPDMLRLARKKLERSPYLGMCELLEADAMDLPFDDGRFDAVTIGFAMRNVPSIERCLREMRRVTRSGGRVLCLELSQPEFPVLRQLHSIYLSRLVPALGWIGHRRRGPYDYLPRSIRSFPDKETLATMMRGVGLRGVRYVSLSSGIAAVHVGEA